jgi:hypothetical protein
MGKIVLAALVFGLCGAGAGFLIGVLAVRDSTYGPIAAAIGTIMLASVGILFGTILGTVEYVSEQAWAMIREIHDSQSRLVASQSHEAPFRHFSDR